MKKTLLLLTLLSICLFISSESNSFGQTDAKSLLLKDLVRIENGKFIAEEYGSFSDFKNKKYEVGITAVAPVDMTSRDNFISIYSSVSIIVLSVCLKNNEIETNDEFHLFRHDKINVPLNISIQIEFTKEGISYQIVTTIDNYKSSNTLIWYEFL